MQCPNCNFDSPLDMKFCGMCGARLLQVCRECSFANPLDYRFCGQCGAPLSPEPLPPTWPLPSTRAVIEDRVPGHSLSKPIILEGQRRPVTVILADIVGSTSLLEQLGTEAWVELMNHALQILEAEVYRFGGRVDQFRGDGLVALFGATLAHEDDPERGVLSALAMQEAFKSYAAQLSEEKGLDVSLRVGVNTGEVIVGSIGDSRQHSEDTAMGEAIALAARMEGAAEPGTVLVSENTYRLAQSQFTWRPLGEIVVKGISQPVTIYRPLSTRTDAGQLSSLPPHGLSAPLIGRETEFETLTGCLENLQTGQGAIVLITGEGGLGKSRLVNEVRQHFARQKTTLVAESNGDHLTETPSSLTWLQGRCRSYDQSRPYSMWVDLLWNWLGTRENESEIERRDRLRQQADALWGKRLAEYYPYLATFLSLPLETPFVKRVKYLDAATLQQQFHLTIRSWVETMAQRGPLALTFSGVHWADASSLELLEYCLPLCDQESLLWLITFRPRRTADVWSFSHRVETEYPHRVTAMTFSPLTEAQSSEMIDHLVGPGVLPAETRTLVLEKAEGNPYYIEELIHSLVEEEALVQDVRTGEWHATRAVATLDLPDTLQSLLLARIDSLSLEERQVLQMAAIVGSLFWSNVLEALAGEAAKLKQHLTTLQRVQLIRERGRIPYLGMEYIFKSALTRDAAYESILSARRAIYHKQVAEYLEQHFDRGSPTQYLGMLAYHYRCAGEQQKELFYTLLAAQQAQEVYANAAAQELYTRALALLDEMEAQTTDESRLYAIRTQKFEVLNGRRAVRFLTGDFEVGAADARALLPLARQLDDDPAWLIDALLQQPGVGYWLNTKELQTGMAVAEEALAQARQLGDRRREMQSLMAVASHHVNRNHPKALPVAERALELARQLGDEQTEVQLLIAISGVYNWSNEPGQGVAYLEAALSICQSLDDKVAEINLLHQIGLQFERRGDYYRLLTEYEQKRLQMSREINHRPLETGALMICGQVQGIYLGDYEAGLTLQEEARQMWRGTPGEGLTWLRTIQMLTAQAKYDEAMMALEHARQVGVQESNEMVQAGSLIVAAMLYNALGGKTYLRQALEQTAHIGQLVTGESLLSRQYEMAAACEATAAHLGLAEAVGDEVEQQMHRRQALESSQAALEIYQTFGYAQLIECVSEEIFFRCSRALAANGRAAEAAEFLQRAYDEMMRKHDLIPPNTPYRQTFLENIPLHGKIRAAHTTHAELVALR